MTKRLAVGPDVCIKESQWDQMLHFAIPNRYAFNNAVKFRRQISFCDKVFEGKFASETPVNVTFLPTYKPLPSL